MTALADLSLCRLCFANEDYCENGGFTRIRKFESLLSSLADVDISQAKDIPQRVCSNCEFQLESSLLLRKRVKFAENVWTKFQERQSNPEGKPIVCDEDLLLCCHLCTDSFDYQGLRSHMSIKHGKGHVVNCEFCTLLQSQASGNVRPTTAVTTETIQDLPPLVFPVKEELAGDDPIPDNFIEEVLLPTIADEENPPVEIDNTESGFSCDKCDKVYTRKHKLKEHIAKHHSDSNPNGSASSGKQRMVEESNHIENQVQTAVEYSIENTGLDRRYVCNLCQISYARSTTLREHLQKKHDIQMPYLIAHTDRPEENLSQNKEKEDQRFYCTVCNASYTRRTKLREHMLKNHNINYEETLNYEDTMNYPPEGEVASGDDESKESCAKKPKLEEFTAKPVNEEEVVINDDHLSKDDSGDHPDEEFEESSDYEEDVAYDPDDSDGDWPMEESAQGGVKTDHSKDMSSDDEDGEGEDGDTVTEHEEFRIEGSGDARKYICKICDNEYTRTAMLRIHLLEKHEVQMPLIDQKGVILTNRMDKDASIHTAEYSIEGPGNDRSFICNLCHVTYTRSTKLREHLQKHHDFEMPYLVTQPIRNKSRSQNTGETRFKCTECDCSYTRKPKLKEHMAKHHGRIEEGSSDQKGETRYGCTECDKSYSRMTKLREHIARHHGPEGSSVPRSTPKEEPESICDECGLSFKKRHNLISHKARHHPSDGVPVIIRRRKRVASNEQLVCEQCGKSFPHRAGLYNHIRRVHTNPRLTSKMLLEMSEPFTDSLGRKRRWYFCPECGEKFCRTNMLRRHVISKHNATLPFMNPNRQPLPEKESHPCSECGKSFYRRTRLREHLIKAHQITIPVRERRTLNSVS